MAERPGIITMKGHSLTLVGQEVHVGDLAPDFEVILGYDACYEAPTGDSFRHRHP
jgi:peroxiredoxin